MAEVISLSHVAIRPGDLLILRAAVTALHHVETANMADQLADVIEKRTGHRVTIIVCGPEWDIESLTDEDMARVGWVRDPAWTPR